LLTRSRPVTLMLLTFSVAVSARAQAPRPGVAELAPTADAEVAPVTQTANWSQTMPESEPESDPVSLADDSFGERGPGLRGGFLQLRF
jgi:hypothetical protein